MAKTAIRLNPKTLMEVREYIADVKAAGIPVGKVLIFGSQAKGTTHADSDIDLAVISSAFGKDYHSELVKLMNLRRRSSNIEPHPMHPDDLKDKWSTFAHEVKTWGIPIR